MEYTVFDSRSLHCKNPYGAVACHTEISVALRPLSAEGFLSCRLVLQRELGETEEEIPLSPACFCRFLPGSRRAGAVLVLFPL